MIYWQRCISKAIRSNEWKLLINEYTDETLLYNLNDSPYEFPDLSADKPEIVEMLTREHQKWQLEHASLMWPAVIYFKAEKDGKVYYFEQ